MSRTETAMTSTRLDGKRVLLTQSNDFMGPALTAVFRDSGAEVVADPRALDQDPALPAAIVREAGRVDVLLIHLALPAPSTPLARSPMRSGAPCSPTWSTRCQGSWRRCCHR
jgi:hypothetical protein